jgi:hypothetical protein
MLIAKVLSTQTPAQIKKHAECFFKQNLITNSAAVKQYHESLSPDKKAQVLVSQMPLKHKTIDSLSHRRKKHKYYVMMLMHTENNASSFLLRKRSKY